MRDWRSKTVWHRLSCLGLAAQAAVLFAMMAVTTLAVACVAFAISGGPGVIAALVAAGVCLVSGESALVLCGLLAQRTDALRAMLVGMLTRMTLPLVLGVGLHVVQPWLTRSGFFFYLLVFYGVILLAETALAVAHLSQDSTSNKAV